MTHKARLEKLEAALLPERAARACLVFGENNATEAVAQFRSANDWPDDGRHPVTVVRIEWASGPRNSGGTPSKA